MAREHASNPRDTLEKVQERGSECAKSSLRIDIAYEEAMTVEYREKAFENVPPTSS